MSPSMPHRLRISGPGNVERTVELAGNTTIGRTTDNGIVLDDTQVSRCHAMLLVQGGAVLLLDMESSNGTTINGAPALPDEPVALADGDVVVIGRVLLRYEAPSG
jgi:SARP family transcriptional regulator, regulator of embCAB operon